MARLRALIAGLTAGSIVCTAGCNLESDEKLKQRFEAQRQEFNQLAAMSREDGNANLIAYDRSPPVHEGISEERARKYEQLFKITGVRMGMVRGGDGAVFFRVQCTGSAIDHDCKGFAFSEAPIAGLVRDLNRMVPGVHFERLTDKWYLFRDVD